MLYKRYLFSVPSIYEIGSIQVLISQMEPRDVRFLVQSHTTARWEVWSLNSGLITKGHALDHLNKQHAHFADENLVHSRSKARSEQRCRQERRLQCQLELDASLGAATYKMRGLGRVAESLSPGM